MSYLSIPGHGTLRVDCAPPSDDGRFYHFWYTGDHDDLLASGLVTADMLEPKPPRRRHEAQEATFRVLNRNWVARNGVPVRHYRIFFRAVTRSQMLQLPGATLALQRWRAMQAQREQLPDDSLQGLYQSVIADRITKQQPVVVPAVPSRDAHLRLVVDNTRR